MKLRNEILVLLLVFGLLPLLISVSLNLPLVLERTGLIYQKAYLQNLRADFRDLDQHLASRHEMIRLLAKLPEPGLLLGERGNEYQIDIARARYTGWINQILDDQQDIIQILFLDAELQERFWLERDERTLAWHPTPRLPKRPNEQFLEAGLGMEPGRVLVSRIRIDPAAGAEDRRKLMTLTLVSTIGGSQNGAMGLVAMSIDVGGLADFYRETVWVNNKGSYLRPDRPIGGEPDAFAEFPGLAEIFAAGELALWKGDSNRQMIWVPMFLTENGVPLWVGRSVDPSPIESFRNALIVRVATVMLPMIFLVMIMARFIASRAEQFGQALTKGLGKVLRDGEAVRFAWKRPRELKELGDQLTRLASVHVEHLQAARKHTRELEESNRYKSEFLANVSHELRTPLNSILLLSKMLAAPHATNPNEQRYRAQVIHDAGRDLRAMIDNILDISRIEAGQVGLDLKWIELRPLLEDLIRLVKPQFDDKGLILELAIDAEAPMCLYSDREKLRQILKNFLSNAAKFTDQGRVVLEAAWRAQSDRPLVLSVADTGIGIPADKQEVIFEAFQQADGSTRRRYGGTGLGLSISRELAGLLGGWITVQSEEGRGSRFTLTMPIKHDPKYLTGRWALAEKAVKTEPSAGARRVDIREFPVQQRGPSAPEPSEQRLESLRGQGAVDKPLAGHWALLLEREVRDLVAETALLESLGLRVQTAADADEALDTLSEEEECALVLVAALVSIENTCDTIRKIRADERYNNLEIVVMGVPAGSSEGDRLKQAGADGFCTKPLGQNDILSLVDAGPAASPEHIRQQTA